VKQGNKASSKVGSKKPTPFLPQGQFYFTANQEKKAIDEDKAS